MFFIYIYPHNTQAPYMNVPASIRDAVVQPKVLHSDPQSFYESTLWWKEKLICLSRMARDNKEVSLIICEYIFCLKIILPLL